MCKNKDPMLGKWRIGLNKLLVFVHFKYIGP